MKKAKNIFITILLGALGSAFWEMCLKRLIQLIIHTLMPYLLQCFNDSFYTRVAHSLDAPAYTTFIFFTYIPAMLLIASPKFWVKFFYTYKEEKAERILQNVMKLTGILVLIYHFFSVGIASTTARDTLNNIEVVAPYITDMEYKLLRSNFFQMDSKSDYENIIAELTSIAKENGLQLK